MVGIKHVPPEFIDVRFSRWVKNMVGIKSKSRQLGDRVVNWSKSTSLNITSTWNFNCIEIEAIKKKELV